MTNAAPAVRMPKLATDRELAYLSPLVVTHSVCIYRRTRLDNPSASARLYWKGQPKIGPKRRSIQSIGWFELCIGPLIFSLNSLGSG